MRKTALPVCLSVLTCLAFGACAEDGDPIPQEHSDVDLIPDETAREARSGPTDRSLADPSPMADEAAGALPLTSSVGGGRYDRQKALEYIRRFALEPNPNVAYCAEGSAWHPTEGRTPADCTNFVSQVLWYGGLPMEYTGGDDGWWYTKSCGRSGSSASWRAVNRLVAYLTVISRRGEFRKSARDLRVGDLIFYRLRREDDGYRCDQGNLFNHSTVVSGFAEDGEPLVSYHSNEAEDVRWNVKNGSPKALGEACAVGFVHIRD